MTESYDMTHFHTHLQRGLFMVFSAWAAHQAWASGYHFGTQSVSTQGTANSSAAEAADPSTIFYNPAGLTKLEGTQATINLNIVAPRIKYEDAHAYYPDGTEITTAPDGSRNVERSGKITDSAAVAPHAYVSHQVNDQVWLGLGMFVPFASGTEYEKHSVLRYNLNELSLQSIALQPTVAYRINPQHAIAAGVVAQNSKATLRQFANFGAFAGRNGVADGYAEVKGDDWGVGYNLAWLWDINDSARMGVNYRSKVSHELQGNAEWQLVGAGFANPVLANRVRQLGYVAKEDASVKLVTPESLSVHGMYRVNPKWDVFGDVTWTRHSRFNQVNLKYANSKVVANPVTGGVTRSDETIIRPNWRNTYKVALGAAYQYSEPLQMRFGVAYDQSPVRNADSRLSTLPDNDRIWLSLGAKYDLNKQHSINAAYSHVFIKNARANVNGWCGAERAGAGAKACVSSRTHGSANYKNRAHIVGLQYTYKF